MWLALLGICVASVFAASSSSSSSSSSSLDPDKLSQRYRNWTYYPDWVIPPTCLNPSTCPKYCDVATGTDCKTDVASIVQLESEVEQGIFRAVYLQFDGVGYESYMASSRDLLHFNLSDPGVIFSPRAGRPPLSWNATPGEFDYGGATFVGPVLQDYNVSATRVLRRGGQDNSYFYAYYGSPHYGYETPPGASGFGSSHDGLTWERAIPQPFLDTLPAHGAQPWEQGQIYAPYLIPSPDGQQLVAFYNAGALSSIEQSGAAYLPVLGVESLPGFDLEYNVSEWVRDPLNPLLPNDPIASYQASDPKVYRDDVQGVWVMIYFCNGGATGGADICIAFSEDQHVWSKASSPIYVHGGHPRGLDSCHAHKVWLTGSGKEGDDTLYLYYTGVTGAGCNTRGILLLTSKPV